MRKQQNIGWYVDSPYYYGSLTVRVIPVQLPYHYGSLTVRVIPVQLPYYYGSHSKSNTCTASLLLLSLRKCDLFITNSTIVSYLGFTHIT